MTVLEQLRANPWLTLPSTSPTCRSKRFAWDGGYFIRCEDCGRIGPVPVMLHIPHTPPAARPKQLPPIADSIMLFLTKLLAF